MRAGYPHVGLRIGKHVLRYIKHCPSLQHLSDAYTPVAEGVSNNGFIVPIKSPFLKTEYAQVLMQSLLLHDLSGLNQWIQLIHLMYRHHFYPQYMATTSRLYQYLKTLNLSVNVSALTVPFPSFRMSPTRGPICQVEDMNIFQIMNETNCQFLSDALAMICQIAVLGFPLTDKVIHGLQLSSEQIARYLRSRLIHGKMDRHWGSMHFKQSIFMPDPTMEGTPDAEFVDLYTSLRQPVLFQARLRAIHMKMGKQQFLGNNSETLQILAEKGMYKHADEQYNKYIRKDLIGNRMGYSVYQHVMRGNKMKKHPILWLRSPEKDLMKQFPHKSLVDVLKWINQYRKKGTVSDGGGGREKSPEPNPGPNPPTSGPKPPTSSKSGSLGPKPPTSSGSSGMHPPGSVPVHTKYIPSKRRLSEAGSYDDTSLFEIAERFKNLRQRIDLESGAMSSIYPQPTHQIPVNEPDADVIISSGRSNRSSLQSPSSTSMQSVQGAPSHSVMEDVSQDVEMVIDTPLTSAAPSRKQPSGKKQEEMVKPPDAYGTYEKEKIVGMDPQVFKERQKFFVDNWKALKRTLDTRMNPY